LPGLLPRTQRQRQYEALRAYFVEGHPSAEAARAFGYSVGAFRVLCHHFRRDPQPEFFRSPPRGPRTQPKKSAAREAIIALRKRNHSVYEISELLKERKLPLSPTAVREVLRAEGFAALPRRLDEERPERPRPSVEPVADVRAFSLAGRQFLTQCGGLFLFIAELARLDLERLARAARLPGSKMIPAGHALRTCLALKLWSLERKGHVMALAADQGLGLFCGLNAMPKKSYLSEYASRVDHRRTLELLAAWHSQVAPEALFSTTSFNLDFHSVPYYGEHPGLQRHYVSAQPQPAQRARVRPDAQGRSFCYPTPIFARART
jgi:transposase